MPRFFTDAEDRKTYRVDDVVSIDHRSNGRLRVTIARGPDRSTHWVDVPEWDGAVSDVLPAAPGHELLLFEGGGEGRVAEALPVLFWQFRPGAANAPLVPVTLKGSPTASISTLAGSYFLRLPDDRCMHVRSQRVYANVDEAMAVFLRSELAAAE